MNPQNTHTLGWRRPARHLGRATAPAGTSLANLPARADLRRGMPVVYDQGGAGSCVAQAMAGAIEYLQHSATMTVMTPSRLALYYEARKRLGSTAFDDGATLWSVLDSAAAGYGPEVLWPYDVFRYADTPPTFSQRHLITREAVAHDLASIRWEVSMGFPVMIGVEVFPSFEGAPNGDVPIPASHESSVGGHAILLCGYDAARSAFLFRNSWGVQWGDDGYGTIPDAYVTDPSLCGEIHSVRAVR